jgi:cystathionine beta-lyase
MEEYLSKDSSKYQDQAAMQYNFDELIERRGTDSIKWDTGRIFDEADALPLWVADMDFRAPQPIIDAILERANHGLYGYILPKDSFCEAIVNWLSRRHAWQVQKSWIVASPGVVPAVSLAVQAFTQPGDKVIIQPPVYMPFLSVVPDGGRQLLLNHLKVENGRYEMDFEDLEAKMGDSRARMMILCSPHNPVGRVWTAEELGKVAELCLKHHIVLVSDEIHCDLVFDRHKHIPAASLSAEIAQNVVTLMAPSKTFNIAGLTTSYNLIPNPELRRAFNNAQGNLHIGANNIFGVIALEAAYNHGEDWLDQLLVYLSGNFDYLLDYLARRIPQIKARRPEGTYLVWLDCRELGLDDAGLKELFLRKARVALNDGPAFGPGGEGFVRINVACPRSILQQALERIEAALG